MKMKRMKRIGILLLIICLLCACSGEISEESSMALTEESVEKTDPDNIFRIYIFGQRTKTELPPKIPAADSYSVTGPAYVIGEHIGSDYHIYSKALEEFEQESDYTIEITYMTTPSALYSLNGDNSMPDVIIGSYTEENDSSLYTMLNEIYLYDMNEFFVEDDIYDSGEYIETILEAGKVNGRQFVFPLTFTMNMLCTSEQSLERHDLKITDQSTFEDIVFEFMRLWDNTSGATDEVLVLPLAGGLVPKIWPFSFFHAASGQMFSPPGLRQVTIGEDYFNSLFDICMSYKQTESGPLELITNAMRENCIEEGDGFTAIQENVGCFAVGGIWSDYYQPLAAQAAYYEWQYNQLGEDFLCIGVPRYHDSTTYEAIITNFGVIPQASRHPEEAYRFIKMLADVELQPYNDLSVNRKRCEESIDKLTFEEIVLKEGYSVEAMSKNTADHLKNMIEHIGGATLPNAGLNSDINFGFLTLWDGTADDALKKARGLVEVSLAGSGYPKSFDEESDVK